MGYKLNRRETFLKILASERFKTEEPTSGMDLHAMSFHARGKGQKNAQGDSHSCICLRERPKSERGEEANWIKTCFLLNLNT